MKERIIFHIPFKIDSQRASASQIRPMKMLQAFKDVGYEVDVIMGYSSEREGQLNELKKKIKNGVEYKFLYSESSTMPTLLTDKNHLPTKPLLELTLFSLCKSHNIPIGLFYRDVYWMYDEYKKDVGVFKFLVTSFFYRLDLFYYKRYLNVLFLPSLLMAKKLPTLKEVKKYPLPSGASVILENSQIQKSYDPKLNVLYVGGLGDFYNLQLFCSVISQMSSKFNFVICCRQDEWDSVKESYDAFLSNGNISIVHKKGEELIELYDKADLACLFVKTNEYRKFAMPFKLFEYLGANTPIISSSNSAVAEFVNKNQVGWVVDYNEPDLKLLLDEIYSNPQLIAERQININSALKKNTWNYRAIEVRNSLLGEI